MQRATAGAASCLYTMTPDSEPILDRLDHHLITRCGFSGSGFKHSPATGRMLTCLALDQEQTFPEDFRPGGTGSLDFKIAGAASAVSSRQPT